jgi:hypothetical protein
MYYFPSNSIPDMKREIASDSIVYLDVFSDNENNSKGYL